MQLGTITPLVSFYPGLVKNDTSNTNIATMLVRNYRDKREKRRRI